MYCCSSLRKWSDSIAHYWKLFKTQCTFFNSLNEYLPLLSFASKGQNGSVIKQQPPNHPPPPQKKRRRRRTHAILSVLLLGSPDRPDISAIDGCFTYAREPFCLPSDLWSWGLVCVLHLTPAQAACWWQCFTPWHRQSVEQNQRKLATHRFDISALVEAIFVSVERL